MSLSRYIQFLNFNVFTPTRYFAGSVKLDATLANNEFFSQHEALFDDCDLFDHWNDS
jgi:hypothetical protein